MFSLFTGSTLCLRYNSTNLSYPRFIYRDAIMHVDPQLTPSITGKAFYTIPASYVSVATAFFNDFLSAALYTCVAFAIGDDSNTPPGSGASNCFPITLSSY